MIPTRLLIISALILGASFSSVYAQGRWQRLPAPRDPQFYVPRNKLEEFDSRIETILIKGRTWVGTVRASNGSARVEATEIRDTRNSTRATGVLITVTVSENNRPEETRCLIDYDEIDPLVRAFDTVGKSDETITKLTHFEARYRTKADFELMVFRQLTGPGAIAAAIEVGYFDRARLFLTLDELTRLRWMVVQAKEKLDEMK